MDLLKHKKTRALILVMCALVITGIIVSKAYYSNVNKSIDPRVIEARRQYDNYNAIAQSGNYDSVFYLLDTIESIYSSVHHYQDAFEIGVLYNNRAAAYLTMALYSGKYVNDSTKQDSLVQLARNAVNKSIQIYDTWLENFRAKSPEEIKNSIEPGFFDPTDNIEEDEKTKILEKRVREIEEAQVETPRRLSVSYTNLGVIYRHKKDYLAAAEAYKKAVELWDRNLDAENNLNKLLGLPLKKRNFIQKLFPPERK